ncbi:phosphatase PAP2 family protein [Sphingomonas sp. BN140010]|uniref:Phosphatase PAP2 family protein n=1 Tax=Sphingomonas arvum TaxID=2992113 RepID=A0ABT3JBF9_9SPHN|nr:phosphatase PAP2 family protein [Sphingomonas sp. BN140010]MCW3796408.1 phosphatase PAP2 family protein [Sphingomonas sp. BN140010]
MRSAFASQLQRLDLAATESAARLLGHSAVFDALIRYLAQFDTFKIFPLVALLCAVASQQRDRPQAVRVLFDGIAAGLLALVVARLVQNLGPARFRPAFLPGFDGPLPFVWMIPSDWSSFPSDTAALATALALVTLRRSRPLGLFALIWALLVSMARLISAFHYPSDLLAGAAIGALVAIVISSSFVTSREARLAERALATAPTLTCLFLVGMLFQLGTMFDDVRHGAGGLLRHIGVLKERPAAPIAAVVKNEQSPSADSSDEDHR